MQNVISTSTGILEGGLIGAAATLATAILMLVCGAIQDAILRRRNNG